MEPCRRLIENECRKWACFTRIASRTLHDGVIVSAVCSPDLIMTSQLMMFCVVLAMST